VVSSSSSSFFFLFSSPNVSRRRLDVYNTSTHGVALVRISDAGLKGSARGSLEIQDAKKSPKNRHLGTIAQLCQAIYSFAIKARIDNRKNFLNSNISPHILTIW